MTNRIREQAAVLKNPPMSVEECCKACPTLVFRGLPPTEREGPGPLRTAVM